jgi:hypothetical protein
MDPDLSQIHFVTSDLLALDLIGGGEFDLVVSNAVLQVMDFDDMPAACKAVAGHLKIVGHFVIFDGYFDSDEVSSVTASLRYSEAREEDFRGMQYTYLSQAEARRCLEEAGLEAIFFEPFSVTVPLSREKGNPSKTYTAELANGAKLSMMEVDAQPWCFLVAKRTDLLVSAST